jgi:hypothetical protein
MIDGTLRRSRVADGTRLTQGGEFLRGSGIAVLGVLTMPRSSGQGCCLTRHGDPERMILNGSHRRVGGGIGDMRGPERPRRLRVNLEEQQERRLAQLYREVPTVTREYRVWTSAEGQAFIAEVNAYREAGVPVRWMAELLGLDDRVLLQIIEDKQQRSQRRRIGRPSRTSGQGGQT